MHHNATPRPLCDPKKPKYTLRNEGVLYKLTKPCPSGPSRCLFMFLGTRKGPKPYIRQYFDPCGFIHPPLYNPREQDRNLQNTVVFASGRRTQPYRVQSALIVPSRSYFQLSVYAVSRDPPSRLLFLPKEPSNHNFCGGHCPKPQTLNLKPSININLWRSLHNENTEKLSPWIQSDIALPFHDSAAPELRTHVDSLAAPTQMQITGANVWGLSLGVFGRRAWSCSRVT